jgi:hypothetical protein
MAHGGKRPNAGRPKNAANKFSEAARAKAAAKGITPLEYFLSVLRNEELDRAERMDAGKAAAPYMHARLESVKHSGDAENPIQTVTRIERQVIDPSQDIADSDAESIPTAH